VCQGIDSRQTADKWLALSSANTTALSLYLQMLTSLRLLRLRRVRTLPSSTSFHSLSFPSFPSFPSSPSSSFRSSSAAFSTTYERKTPLEHVLLRPGMMVLRPYRIALRSGHLLLSSRGYNSGRENKGYNSDRGQKRPRLGPVEQIAHALFARSKKKQTLPGSQLDALSRLLQSLKEQIPRMQKKSRKGKLMPVKLAAQLLYSLQMFKSNDAIGIEFVKLFTAILPISEEFGAQAVGMSLWTTANVKQQQTRT
jgi:hypothetical protein